MEVVGEQHESDHGVTFERCNAHYDCIRKVAGLPMAVPMAVVGLCECIQFGSSRRFTTIPTVTTNGKSAARLLLLKSEIKTPGLYEKLPEAFGKQTYCGAPQCWWRGSHGSQPASQNIQRTNMTR